MSFQFLCPQGHLLEGEEAHMGMQCQCPQCGAVFIIPTVQRGADATIDEMIAPFDRSEVSETWSTSQAVAEGPSPPLPPASPSSATPPADDDAARLDESELIDGGLSKAAEQESLLHIPCPNGHELEVPLNMIGHRALCPHCRVEFRLRREKSVEFLRQQEAIDRRRARFWFQLSIVVASFVGVVILAMLVRILFFA
jgi:hypothetical protein